MTMNVQTMKAEIISALDALPLERLRLLFEFSRYLQSRTVQKPANLLNELDAWQETLYLLSEPANAEHLRQSIIEAETGQTANREDILVLIQDVKREMADERLG
ncbi:hypothetical protein QUF63_00360 [Anaerolineales bacterium HSG25]|nr:hypothetical protein [Anaerolineales bacterium HSG25]